MPTTLPRAIGFLLGFWLALTLLGSFARPASGDPGGAADPELAALETRLYAEINALRQSHRRVPLVRRADLDAAARGHSADMAARHYLSHDTPEGRNPVDRIRAEGVDGFTLAGENVGLTSRADPNREIVNGWMLSPVHRENLLAPAFNATGVGIARAPDGTLYYTQLYASFPR